MYGIKNIVPVDFRLVLFEIPVIMCIIGMLSIQNENRLFFSNKFLVFIGNISTEIYLFHYSVIHFLDSIGIMQIQYLGVIMTAVCSSIIAYGIKKARG